MHVNLEHNKKKKKDEKHLLIYLSKVIAIALIAHLATCSKIFVAKIWYTTPMDYSDTFLGSVVIYLFLEKKII